MIPKWTGKAKNFLTYVEVAVYDENGKERASVVTPLLEDDEGYYYTNMSLPEEKNRFDENWNVIDDDKSKVVCFMRRE